MPKKKTPKAEKPESKRRVANPLPQPGLTYHEQIEHLSARLATIRGKRSQRQFSRELGVYQQNVNRYEAGVVPTAAFLAILGERENVNLDWLLLGRGRKFVTDRATKAAA